ncbi:MAG: hypothetical protein ACAI25_12500 [Planctomycetota bacterium]
MQRARVGTERGSALVITVVMLFLMIAFTSVLIGAPAAHLGKVSSATTRERSVAIADAGLRDALQYMGANTVSELAVSTPFTTTASSTPSTGTAAFTTNSFFPVSTTTGVATKYWDGNSYGDTNVLGSTAYPFIQKSFGDGRYAWRVIRRDTEYWQIISIGQAKGGAGTSGTYAVIEAMVKKSSVTASIPGAASFIDPTNQGFTTNDTIYNSQNGGSPPSINGTDAAGSGTNIPGVAIQNPTLGFGAGSATVVGTPSAIVGGTSGNAGPSAGQWSALQTLAEKIASGANGASNYVTATYPTTITGPYVDKLVHVKVPANTTINADLVTINGVNGISGILVIELEDNVTLNSQDLYTKNGTGNFRGAMIILQRGRVNVGASGLHFIHKNGNNADFLQYDSVAVGNALAPLSSNYKIASYVIR